MSLVLLTLCSAGGVKYPPRTGGAPGSIVPGAAGGPAAGHPPRTGPAGSPAATTAAENALPGTADWRVGERGTEHEIEGFADRVSVLPGETFRLFVSTTSPTFTIEAFRTGWYGGTQARRVWASPLLPGREQAPARVNPTTRAVSAPWRPTTAVSAAGWPEGSYVLRLRAASGAQRHVPITVRSASTAGKIVVLNATTTWQAYNTWGGYNLYKGPSGGMEDRSYAVSFDRPYDRDGAEKYMMYEQPAVALAEKLGLPLAYATDNDLHALPRLLDGARGLLTLGHDEYWSTAMWKSTVQARDSGVNLAFLGANGVNRHIRFEKTRLGPNRLVVCYKDAGLDPISRTNPAESTQDWRLPPRPRPESSLIGIMYNCFPAEGAFTVYQPRHWMFRGTGVRRGSSFPGVIGPESDAINWTGPTPRPIEVIARSPILCGNSMGMTADATYYTVRGGAGVVAIGTMRWVCALRGPRCGHGVTTAGQRFVEKVTVNLLTAMAQGPLGLAHPAKDNLARLRPLS